MTSTAAEYDVVVAGAGLVGLALARSLASIGLKVAVADRSVPTASNPAGESDWDPRVYAISPGSSAFLRTLGVWGTLPRDRVASIKSMRVEGDAGAVLNFSAYDLGERELAAIVEERALRAALVPLVHSADIPIHAPVAFSSLSFSDDAATLLCADGMSLSARLVVGADGVRSWLREAAGIESVTRSYGQTAVVANFNCERPHRGRAFQWFLQGGAVLAWLPLPGDRVSIVWSAPDSLAQELLALDAAMLANRVASAGQHRLGSFECITPGVGFPLQSVELSVATSHRVVLAGDAAHGVHPLAGQGINLGFGDVATLCEVLRERGALNDAGAPILLERYARRRAEPVRAMQTVIDGLTRLFGTSAPLVRYARNFGMAALERLPLAKRYLAQTALR